MKFTCGTVGRRSFPQTSFCERPFSGTRQPRSWYLICAIRSGEKVYQSGSRSRITAKRFCCTWSGQKKTCFSRRTWKTSSNWSTRACHKNHSSTNWTCNKSPRTTSTKTTYSSSNTRCVTFTSLPKKKCPTRSRTSLWWLTTTSRNWQEAVWQRELSLITRWFKGIWTGPNKGKKEGWRVYFRAVLSLSLWNDVMWVYLCDKNFEINDLHDKKNLWIKESLKDR